MRSVAGWFRYGNAAIEDTFRSAFRRHAPFQQHPDKLLKPFHGLPVLGLQSLADILRQVESENRLARRLSRFEQEIEKFLEIGKGPIDRLALALIVALLIFVLVLIVVWRPPIK